jgi:hypothetical protein
MSPLSSIDVAALTVAERNALAAMALQPLIRVKHGWMAAGKARRISREVAGRLSAQGLARQMVARGRVQLCITGAGRQLHDVLAERAKR